MVGTRLSDLNPMHFYGSQVLETILVGLCFLILYGQNSKEQYRFNILLDLGC